MSIENIFPNKQQFDTINERLLEIANNVAGGNSKLDKPATPTAESAVTMSADGTVGTKPLSEIGEKLYKHYITIKGSNFMIFLLLYTHSNEPIDTISKIYSVSNNILYGAFNGQYGNGSVSFFLNEVTNQVTIYGCISPFSGNTPYVFSDGSNIYNVSKITDSVIEL